MDASTMSLVIDDLRGVAEGGIDIRNDGDGGFSLLFDGMEILRADWADAPARLVTTFELGKVVPSRKILVYEAMLTYNLLWQETGGARLAMAGPDGQVMLVHEMPAEQMTASDLSAALARLCQVGGAWRRFVIDAAPPEPVQALSWPPSDKA
ncbi:MAG: type III secretion system chaperone [Hydrogenophaga sp.]|uniref:type III secretion system chaperone n=1 Tax=Hydrogenophaga sp. TaxID=1904254 RepID=UPI001D805956|nr:type III secretion system chaperone [Hydrogenophaga sp.]MBX3609010.1 type III secretion system chaperone [Hydrogenophaga sp.]